MRVADFDFDLPPERIALRPVEPRDAARMLAVRGPVLEDGAVRDLPRHLRAGDVLVVNDTRVIPARLDGKRGAASVDFTLHKQAGLDRWHAFARGAKKLRAGDLVEFAQGLAAEVVEKGAGGEVLLAFNKAGADLIHAIEAVGHTPLPPYIERRRKADARDIADYQTLFAEKEGAVAAPTAGLHFTENLRKAIEEADVSIISLTLHVGAGTFLPVKVEDTAEHRMHAEFGHLTAEAADRINAARAAGGRIAAVGTTSLRLLETAARADGTLAPFEGDTDIFITPGYRFKAVDLLMTNFHLPRSTLFMLVSAFAGFEAMKAAYAHAIAEEYRFYSYGDSSLLYREGLGA
jgi:S-adenosylmethionine:tRNA ribosyltransferase-isomerase